MDRVHRQRYTLPDLYDLARCHEYLTGSIMALNESKWAGAIPMIVSLQQADRVVCRLYNKAESGFRPEQIKGDTIPSGQRKAEASGEIRENG